MTDDSRLRESGTDPFELALLSSARLDQHPSDGPERALAAIGLLVPSTLVAAAPTAGGQSGPAAGAIVSAKLGLPLALLVVGAMVATGVGLSMRTEPVAISTAPSAVLAPETAPSGERNESPPSAGDGELAASAHGSASALPEVSRPSSPKAAANVGTARAGSSASAPLPSISREIALVDEARADLARGDINGATRALDTYDTSFPRGSLTAEATVARIEVCLAKGENERAARLGETLLASHPGAAYERRVSRLLDRAQRPR